LASALLGIGAMQSKPILGLLVAFAGVFHIAGCECDEASYPDNPSNIVSCRKGKLTVRSAPCFGRPDSCSYAAAGGKLSFSVAKEECGSGPVADGCVSDPVEFDCSGAPLPAATYEFASSGGNAVKLDVAADGSCVQR
jgi:hypothetical protein